MSRSAHFPARRLSAVAALSAMAVTGLTVLATPAVHAADQVVLTPVSVDTSATRATGHNDFRADGVRVWTEGSTSSDKTAGYFDVDVSLADAGEPSMDWETKMGDDGYQPGMQLKTDFNGDGDIDGILVGDAFLPGRWWLAGGKDRKPGEITEVAPLPVDDTQPSYRQNIATLDEWRALYPAADVLQAGWSLGSGALGDGVIHSITVGGTEYAFSGNEHRRTVELYASDLDTSETRATGHNDVRANSVRVWTEGNTSTDKAAAYFDVDQPFATAGEPTMAWRANGGGANTRPGMQLVVDVDGDGAPDGILVGEPIYEDIAVATNWWLTNGSKQSFKDLAPSDDGGNGSALNGTLAEWRNALPDTATIVKSGWSLGSGVKGDGIIDSLTVGLTTYTFTNRNRAPEAAAVNTAVFAGRSRIVVLDGSDIDGDDLTFEVNGKEVPGGRYLYTAGKNFSGVADIPFTVKDGRGGEATGSAKVNVLRAPTVGGAYIWPGVVTSKRKVLVTIVVASTGTVSGGKVWFKVDGRAAGGATVVGDRASLVLPRKLRKGTHRIQAGFMGTKGAAPITINKTIQVRR